MFSRGSAGGTTACSCEFCADTEFSVGDMRRRVGTIEMLLKSKNINEFQKDKLRKELQDLELEMEAETKLSKHPQEIGSVWVGGDYVHGPRIRQPDEFEFVKNVEPSPKFYHFEGADKIPKSLPRGSKLVVGKLRKTGDWALQSTLIPKNSKLGKSLIKR
jgi:hypothetical protein